MLPHGLPTWHTVYEQTQRKIAAGCLDNIVYDLRHLFRKALGRNEEPSAVILNGRTLQSTIESGCPTGFDGHKKTRGSKRLIAVDTLGQLLACLVTPANEQ